jgi:hypothetical protein
MASSNYSYHYRNINPLIHFPIPPKPNNIFSKKFYLKEDESHKKLSYSYFQNRKLQNSLLSILYFHQKSDPTNLNL